MPACADVAGCGCARVGILPGTELGRAYVVCVLEGTCTADWETRLFGLLSVQTVEIVRGWARCFNETESTSVGRMVEEFTYGVLQGAFSHPVFCSCRTVRGASPGSLVLSVCGSCRLLPPLQRRFAAWNAFEGVCPLGVASWFIGVSDAGGSLSDGLPWLCCPTVRAWRAAHLATG